MRNGEDKELICMTHGHELRWRYDGEGEGEEWGKRYREQEA